MSKYRMSLLASAAVVSLAAGSISTAHANYLFSGSGTSGFLTPGSEPWFMGLDASGQAGWGSPGVSHGVTTYTQSSAAYGLIVNFSGGSPVSAGSITIGNAAACAGSSGGGTTFCNISTSPFDIWEAFQTAPDTVEFLAQSAAFNESTGESYFVNLLFSGAVPTSFTGEWLTSFTPEPIPPPSATPLPATLPLFAGGLGLTGLLARRKKRKADAATAAA